MRSKDEISDEIERLLKLMGEHGANGYDEGIIEGLKWAIGGKDER